MHRIDGPGATVNNEFTEGNPATAVPATEVTADWLNTLQREVVAVVEASGQTLDKDDDEQLLAAINTLIASSAVDTLNAAQASIAVASTVNLTTGAPNTSHVLLTGGGTVDNFTVAAGRTYFVTLGAATTFTVSASIATGNARSIAGRIGDTLIIYATAANIVRVVMHQPRDGWASLNSGNGYQIFPSGLIVQWGNLVNSATAGDPTAVVFPISVSVVRQISNTADAATAVNSACWVDNLTTSGFNSRCAVANASSRWVAYGYL